MIDEIIARNRSYRRFDHDVEIPMSTLQDLVALARLSPCGGNGQPLKYMLSCTEPTNGKIFATLKWAAHLSDWPGPSPSEQPTAYILILNDTTIKDNCGADHCIAAQSMLLGAVDRGLGGCMLGAIDRPALCEALNIPEHLQVKLVLAIGKPRETIIVEDVGPDGSTKYYRDKDGNHHVPKRPLSELIVPIP
jgi:nitroreductase